MLPPVGADADLMGQADMDKPTCSASRECDRTDLVGYDKFCRMHYQRWRTTGDPLTERRFPSKDRAAELSREENETGLRTCKACKEVKSLADDFIKNSTYRNGRSPLCHPCRKAAVKAAHDRRKERDPEGYSRRWRNTHLMSEYGITADEYDERVKDQRGKCAACGEVKKAWTPGNGVKGRADFLVVDHDHETGHVRGLLCNPCNLALGFAEDSIKRLEQLRAYLLAHKGRIF